MNQVIFNEIQALKRKLIPAEKLILFGSQARGDAREDSDWDLLVLLDKEKRNFNEDYDKYAYPFVNLEYRYPIKIDVQVHYHKNWESHHSVFKHQIKNEGVEII